jgi:NAD(P)-dependent dehydrogenase (short-subunit alcohol dehydrogenase family)
MLTEFGGRTAVITGAGSGFGREFALIGARRGMKLVLADIQSDALQDTEQLVRDLGLEAGDVISQVTDVSKADQVDALAERAHQQFGAVHLLFNNAGVATGGLMWEHDTTDWEWVLGVNVMGVANGVRAFVPAMVQQKQPAHIVNTASVAGLLSPPTMGVYNVSKQAVVGLSETLYHDLQLVQSPVGVSVLCPAFVPTGIAQSHRNRPGGGLTDDQLTDSMRATQASTEKAVSSGKISASDVAQTTFEAIESDRFYIVTHEKIMDSVRLRGDDIAQLRNPTDPYSLRAASSKP